MTQCHMCNNECTNGDSYCSQACYEQTVNRCRMCDTPCGEIYCSNACWYEAGGH